MEPEATIQDEPEDERLRAWFAPVLQHGTRWCAPNLDTKCAFVRVGGVVLPLTVNDAQWSNSWVCSPFTHYVTYALEEIQSAVGAVAACPAGLMLRCIGAWLRLARFNRVVMVNNWLMSTNPWPRWDGETLPAILRSLRQCWPDYAFVFRSLNERADAPLLRALAGAGARLIPSRQVWWYEPGSDAVARSRDWKKDLRLLQRDDLERVEHESLQEADFAKLTALYAELYLEKYSRHNPQYTAPWLQHLWRERLLRFTALRERGGDFVGVEACGIIHGTMVSPIVGYATSRPVELGLYRRLAALPVLAAQEARVPLNLSAGVGRFKALRGGEPVMEYLAVTDSHLPLQRRLPWRVIEALSRNLLAPLVRRWRL